METELLDYINIKTLPELIINELKQNNKSKIRNLRSFYTSLLNYLSPDIKDSYLNRILKYLSSKDAIDILILDDIKDNIYEKELLDFFKEIVSYIDNNKFYDNLNKHCTFIYFDNDELDSLKDNFNDRAKYLYLLFKHACCNYRNNTPSILAERLLLDSYSLWDSNPTKAVFLKTAADLNSPLACLLYGNLVKGDDHLKFNYYLKGCSIPECIWEVAFMAENMKLNDEELEIVKKECKDVIKEGEKYLDNSVITLNTKNDLEKDSLLTALKMMLYLANVKNSSKGYCSVGKYFIDGMIAYTKDGEIDENKTLEEGINYSLKSVRLGNIHAMQNLGGYYFTHNKALNKAEVLLHISADAKDLYACAKFAKILLKKDDVETSEKYFKDSPENDGEAKYQLAMIYEKKEKIDEAINSYKEAIRNKYYKAVLKLANLYFDQYMKDKTNNAGYLILAVNTIESYYECLSKDEKKEADFLLKTIKK